MNAPTSGLFKKKKIKDSIKLKLKEGTRFVVLSDLQVPFEDSELLNNIIEDFVPDFRRGATDFHLFLAGDVIDNYSLSRFPNRVTPLFTLEQEVERTIYWLEKLSKEFSSSHFAFGNHEDRFERELYMNNPQFVFATRTLEELLRLKEFGFDYVDYLKHYDVNGFIITHGDITTKYSASVMLNNYQASGCSGHTNRPQSHTHSSAASGEPDTWHNLGMLCIKNMGDFIPDWRKIMPWQQGFGIGEVVDGKVHFQNIRVHHGVYWACGKAYYI